MVQVLDSIAVSDKTSDVKDIPAFEIPEACAPLLAKVNAYLGQVLAAFTDEQIIEWSCNDAQRKQTAARVEALVMDLRSQTNPCVSALEEIVAELDAEHIFEIDLGNKEVCIEVLGDVLPWLRNNLGSTQFMEVGVFLTWDEIIATGLIPGVPVK